MKVIVFGASGMIGQGVLRECLLDPRVERVLVVGRTPLGQADAKLSEIVHGDFTDFAPVRSELAGYDACFWCLGVSSAGMTEEQYTRVTYEYALAAARILVEVNPSMTFCFVSGGGTDSTEQARAMWARVKGKTENALLKVPFARAYMFRPGFVQPMHGIKSRTRSYRIGYAVLAPLYPALKKIFPAVVTTTDEVAKAMLHAAAHGAPKAMLEVTDINALAAEASVLTAATTAPPAPIARTRVTPARTRPR
jgi:uncharacterized protein YbjT (DUF2867 family)